MRYKRSQIATTDLIISVIVILLFVGIVIAATLWGSDNSKVSYGYGSVLFSNIGGMGSNAFVSNYRVDDAKLLNFKGEAYSSIKSEILKDTKFIDSRSDICIFFDDLSGTTYIAGEIYDPLLATYVICPTIDPCKDYEYVTVFTKPLLYQSRIQNLLIMVCSN